MQKQVEVTFKSRVDDLELEFIHDGILIEDEHKILKFEEEIDNQKVDTAIIFDDTIMINRSNGVEMFQEFIEGETTVMDYAVGGMAFDILVHTEEIINEENYLRIKYTSTLGDVNQSHEIEIYYS